MIADVTANQSGVGTASTSVVMPAIVTAPVITPTKLSFAPTAVGTNTAAQTITVKNTGTTSLTLSSVTLSGAQADDFMLSKTCGAPLATGASCTLSVTFKPVSAGAKNAGIAIADNAAGSPQSIALSGTGTAVP